MGLVGSLGSLFREKSRFTHDSLIWEVTARCNLRCPHCYNVWKDDVDYPVQELDTKKGLSLIDTAVKKSSCTQFTFTGGEPCLREDLETLVRQAQKLGCETSLITNGTLLTEKRIDSLMEAGVRLFELPLNGPTKESHDAMSGGIPSFDKVVRAAAHITAMGGDLAFVFVSTTLNRGLFPGALELGIALGSRAFLYNRYNGGGAHHKTPEKLMPSIDDLHSDLAFAQKMSQEYGVAIGASIAMPPCLIDQERFPNLGFGFCAAGTKEAYYTLDPVGNLRPCNHTPTIIGNIFRDSMEEMAHSQVMADFVAASPDICTGCSIATTCLGGCKAAGEACYGTIHDPDPFLVLNKEKIKKR